MAILPGVPGLSVHIRVAGEIATEYQDPHEVENADLDSVHSCCYIESKAGDTFSIELTATPEYGLDTRFQGLCMNPSLDGKKVTGRRILLLPHREKPETLAQTGIHLSSDVPNMVNYANFIFIPIASNDEPQTLQAGSPDFAKSLGIIAVQVKAGKWDGFTKKFQVSTFDTQNNIEVNEKLMKGKDLSHGSSVSIDGLISEPKTCKTVSSQNIGTFYFYPRSHDALKSLMLIPRSPSPSPSPLLQSSLADDVLEHLSEAEIRRLASERLRDVKVGIATVDWVKNENSVSIKRLRESTPQPVRPLKTIKLQDGTEAFDLTED
ncbi:hypothetical protein AK830_g5938 [Neonectria ditissima]|uniref:DUF7918 domain-containing protein n=1 Tax=Neonectria ditissima TaxID=78410 RepID=A0A0P7BKQ9_9HYPO|nr:hypothetical protein AK830_g5938 [Neonectria ditissima]